MDFILCKLEQTLHSLQERSIRRSFPLTERFSAPDPLPRHKPETFLLSCKSLVFSPFSPQAFWGRPNESRVFLLPVTLPQELAGESVFLRITTGREGGYTAFNPQFLAYVDGELRQGMDINHTLLPLCENAEPGRQIRVILHAFAGTEPGNMQLHTELICFRRDIRRLFFSFLTAFQAMLLLPDGSGQRAELCNTLLRAADCLDFRSVSESSFLESAAQAEQLLEQEVYLHNWGEPSVKVYAIGHTHIDIAWRWTVEQSRQKVQRSFRTVLALMDRYPDYRFFSSQPLLYEFVKEDNPELYRKIKEKIHEGRWEAEGGMWLEADCNLPCGESLVRQIYYGKKFLREEFGVESEILWMPDSFGYTAALPQLMRQSGLRYFLTSKLSWNEFNRTPHDIFLWEGLDGSHVLACMITTPDDCGLPNSPDFSTYNATLQPKNVRGVWERMVDKQVTRRAVMPYGYGDGGGGPTEEMLESASRMARGLPGLPQLTLTRADAFFHDLEQDIRLCKRIPRFRGELYLEFHRGTYTSVARVKRANRRAEFSLLAAEFVCAFAGGADAACRERLWKDLLLHQFHDVLPGSAIQEVYAQAEPVFSRLQDTCRQLISRGVQTLLPGKEETFCIVNPLWEDSPQVLLASLPAGMSLRQDNIPMRTQLLANGRTAVFFPSLPALSILSFSLAQDSEPSQPADGLIASPSHLENTFFSLLFDQAGEIVSLYDKWEGRELIRAHQTANALFLFEDRPATCDAWNIDISYREKKYPVRDVLDIRVTEYGPVCAAVTVRRAFLHSHAVQTIRIYRDLPRIDFETEIDWHEEQTLLKAFFPLDLHAHDALCGTQFGNIRRPVTQSNSWEEARFETCVHGYADLSEGNYGVSLFTGDKYGIDFLEGGMSLTLLKGPIDPWRGADEGLHRFTYCLFPHQGDFGKAKGVLASSYDRIASGICPQTQAGCLRFLRWTADTVAVEAVKPAEDGNGLVVRLYEYGNCRCAAELSAPGRQVEFWECGLLENQAQILQQENGRLRLSFRPYEIKTVRIRVNGR